MKNSLLQISTGLIKESRVIALFNLFIHFQKSVIAFIFIWLFLFLNYSSAESSDSHEKKTNGRKTNDLIGLATLDSMATEQAEVDQTRETNLSGETQIHPSYKKDSETNSLDSEEKLFDKRLIVGQKINRTGINNIAARGLGFFDKDSTLDFYNREIILKEQPKVQILNTNLKLEEALEENNDNLTLTKATKKGTKEEREEMLPKDLQGILAKFGNPEEEPAIIPEEKAPDSYKGLMAALEAGDDELAYRYARQYVRYQRNLDERVKKITDFSIYAMEEDGTVLKTKRDLEDPEYEAIKAIAEKTKAKWGQHPFKEGASGYSKEYFEATKSLELDEKTKDLIKLAELSEDKALMLSEKESEEFSKRASLKEFDATIEEQAANRDIKKGVPVDPQGKVLVYFFSRPADGEGFLMSQAVESIYNENKDNQKFSLVSLTIDRTTKQEIADIKKARRSAVPLRSGGDLAEKLGIKRSPSVVFIAPTTGKAFIAEGLRSYDYLNKVVKHVMGGADERK